MKYSAIVFDLDGTLLYTLEDLRDSVNYSLAEHNLPQQTMEQINAHVGNGVRRLVEQSVPGGEKYADFEDIFLMFKKHYAEHCCDKTRPYGGIIPVLEKMKSEGIKTAVITNKFQSAAEEVCSKYFPGLLTKVFGEIPGTPRKPAPDIVFKALKALDVSLENAIMFGDSETDEKTAQNAKISHYAVLWGFRTKEQLKAAGAEHFLHSPEEIIKAVLG